MYAIFTITWWHFFFVLAMIVSFILQRQSLRWLMILNCLKNSSESIWFYYICAAYSTKFPFSFESASQKLFDSICWRKSNGNKEGKPFSIAEAQTISRSTNNKPELELGIYTFSRSMRKWFSLSGWFILRKIFFYQTNEWDKSLFITQAPLEPYS